MARRTFFIGLAGSGLALLAALCVISREPSFQGKPCRVWLRALDDGANTSAATNAIHQMGAAALPYYRTELRAKDSAWKKKFVELVAKWFHWQVRFTPDHLRRERALRGCALLGPLARPAIPDLGRALNHGEADAALLLEAFGA